MRLLFDADVLLDVALDREPFADESSEALNGARRHPFSGILFLTFTTCSVLLGAMRKRGQFISDMLRFSAVASGGTEAVNHALSFSMDDFEDALQGAAAIASDAQFIITRNVCDYRRSPLPAMTPHNFLLRVCES